MTATALNGDISVVNVTTGSDVGRLGEAAKIAEEVVVTPVVGSRETVVVADPAKEAADKAAADKVVADKAAADKVESDKVAANKTALDTAEKAVTDAKTPEEKIAAEAALKALKSAQSDKPGTAPEKYEAFTLPAGVAATEAEMAPFQALAKELSLSQSQAQKLVDFEAARVQAQVKGQTDAWNKLMGDRLATLKADADIGGAKFDESVGHAKRFLGKYGTPELQKYLNESDAGSHVELVRALAKAGKAMGEDGFVSGASPAAVAAKPIANRMFPTAN